MIKTDLQSQVEAAEGGGGDWLPLGRVKKSAWEDKRESKIPWNTSVSVIYFFNVSHCKDEKPRVGSPQTLLWEMR